MKAVDFEGSNAVLGLEGCYDLPVLRMTQQVEGMGEVPVHVSIWELDTDDIINVLTTQRVRLTVVSSGQPPVLLEVLK